MAILYEDERLKAKQQKPLTGASKDDTNKPPVYQGFLAKFPRAIKAVSYVSVVGSHKYNAPIDSKEFLNVPDAENRYKDAMARHILDEVLEGRTNGQDAQVLHAAQRCWDSMAALEAMLMQAEEAGHNLNLLARPVFDAIDTEAAQAAWQQKHFADE